MATVKSILTHARDLIAGGWTRGEFHRKAFGRDCYCAVGAINMALSGDPDEASGAYIHNRVMNALNRAIGWDLSIVKWNDHPNRTKRDVLAAFERAIQDAE